jgi:hypothetical protein
MALIRKITYEEKSTRPQDEVVCTYCIQHQHGVSRLTLRTYGRPDRENPEVASQTIQFDEEGAKRLRELIDEAFPPLRKGASTH